MCGSAFHASVVEREPKLVSVVCRGELDISTTESFEEAIELALSLHPVHLFVDASRLSFMSIDALGYVLDLTARCARLGIGLGLELGPATWRVVDHLRPDEAAQLRGCREPGSAIAEVSRVCDDPLEAARGSGQLFTRGAAPSPS
jgi:hypothetical protein